jgi:hypothetical protein
MQSATNLNRPSIIICTSQHTGLEAKLRELQAGMEEEGVPCSLLGDSSANAAVLAYKGAQASLLGVGVGISASALCIHHQKLPEDQPLFVIEGEGTLAEWRNFGYNAARLVKGLPFKESSLQTVAGSGENMAQLYETVREIILKVLQESAQGHGEVNTWSKTP